MYSRRFIHSVLLAVSTVGGAVPASAQIVEAVGSRALGMGGAFVAVASDGSATWWNPAGLAAGPFVDLALAGASTEAVEARSAWRQRALWLALATPPLGLGYYRLRFTDIRPFHPTAEGDAGREDRGAGIPVRSLSATQVGITLVQTLVPGVHAGTTLKYLRGTLRSAREGPDVTSGSNRTPQDLLDRGDALDGGETEGRFDVDLGVLAVAGPWRLGMVGRNLRRPGFGGDLGIRIPRQVRLGVAFDSEVTTGLPLTMAVDLDVHRYATTTGERRVVAVGAERWFLDRRFGVRGGGRFNTAGARERSASAGASVAVRPGVYVDGHAVRGGTADERGWGLAARVSF